MGAKSSNTLILNATVEQISALLLDGAFAMSLNMNVINQTPTAQGLWFYFDHGISMSSWGETITIGLTPLQPGMTRVDITSKCDMPTQIIDWGKNSNNVNAISVYISQNIGRYAQYAAPAGVPAGSPAADRKFCGKCGTPLQLADRFCGRCGAAQP